PPARRGTRRVPRKRPESDVAWHFPRRETGIVRTWGRPHACPAGEAGWKPAPQGILTRPGEGPLQKRGDGPPGRGRAAVRKRKKPAVARGLCRHVRRA